MADSVAQFNRVLKDFGERTVPDLLVQAQRKIALTGLSKLVLRTPVRTGRARGGWQCEILDRAGVARALRNIAAKHERLDKNGAATITAGAAIIEKSPPFCCITIVNNVGYILELERGHSGQAPNGMLALTFDELREAFK